MNRSLAILLTLFGLLVTIGVSFLFLVFAGAAAGNGGNSGQFTVVVLPVAIILLVAQAVAAVALLALGRNVASVAVAMGPLAFGYVMGGVFRVVGLLVKMLQ
jgi:hypothetical protein